VQGSACHGLQEQRSDTNTNPEYEYRNPGETGLRALIASARHSIFISQQDMLSCVYSVEALFDERVFAALGDKVAHGIPIKIVLSAEDARAGGDSYSNRGHFLMAPVRQTAETLTQVVAKLQNVPYDRARALVCTDVGLATIRNSVLPIWPNGSGYANHAKVVSVDDAAFYIGSQNLYPARLQELGLIVESHSASATLKHTYLDPLWGQSRGLAYIDPAHRVCGPF
jgi:phosphatidylserine/phosphatidylglycerophosphate/cardiolipin synthase-like enzyme